MTGTVLAVGKGGKNKKRLRKAPSPKTKQQISTYLDEVRRPAARSVVQGRCALNEDNLWTVEGDGMMLLVPREDQKPRDTMVKVVSIEGSCWEKAKGFTA